MDIVFDVLQKQAKIVQVYFRKTNILARTFMLLMSSINIHNRKQSPSTKSFFRTCTVKKRLNKVKFFNLDIHYLVYCFIASSHYDLQQMGLQHFDRYYSILLHFHSTSSMVTSFIQLQTNTVLTFDQPLDPALISVFFERCRACYGFLCYFGFLLSGKYSCRLQAKRCKAELLDDMKVHAHSTKLVCSAIFFVRICSLRMCSHYLVHALQNECLPAGKNFYLASSNPCLQFHSYCVRVAQANIFKAM